jgi:tRNA threonylcarbamoyl adenosine modification protein YjeE
MYKYTLKQLEKQAESYAREVTIPTTFFLYGGVGSGKTTFAQMFIRRLLPPETMQRITSPTFNIVHTYETLYGTLWHVDLYRLKNESEIFELGLLEAMQEHVCLVEWPQMLEKYVTEKNVIVLDLSAH